AVMRLHIYEPTREGKVTTALLFRYAAKHRSVRFSLHKTIIKPMKTTSPYIKIALPLFAVAILTAASAQADTYSWTNFQSDIAGVAQHVDENLVNPWGMAASANGTIWVSDNGTGVSTLYHQDGTAVYKGATLGVANGHNFLYVTDFHTGKVETYDESFHQVNPGGFVDPNLPAGYAPFGIRNFNGEIFVTYAKQDHAKHDDVPGPGFGFVNVFDT